MKGWKKALKLALAVLPVSLAAGWFVLEYQMAFIPAEELETAVAQVGSLAAVKWITAAQAAAYAVICGFFGWIFAEKTGLAKPFRLERGPLLRTAALSVIFGVVFSLDYWTFGAWIPGIRESAFDGMTPAGWIASVLYGGVVEELMLRLFMMTALALLIWKVFFRKRAEIPASAVVAANIAAAVLFAAGHLPATLVLFGSLTPMILLRCFLFNGGFGLFFGELYRRYGIQYAMVAHALMHIVSKLIWTMFA